MTMLFFLGAIISLYIALGLFSQYWRLRQVPGPILATVTNLWRFRIQYRGPIVPHLLDLHKKYGSLVRIGPNTISVSDATYVSAIYTNKGDYIKADSYEPMRVFINGQSVGSIVDMQDEEQNRALKRAIGGAFTTKSLLDYEPDVDETLEELLQRIRHNSTFILHDVLQWFQLDFLMKIAFTETPGHLQHGADVYGLSKLIETRLGHWFSWQSLPQLERFIYRNPIWGRFFAQPSEWAKMSRKRFNTRLAVTKEGQELVQRDLLQKCIEYSEKYPNVLKPQTITSVVNSIISAGTGTTSGAMTAMLYFLLKSPTCYKLLMEELHSARRSGNLSVPPRYTEVSRLPYLDAVLRETLRLKPAIGIPMERVVPPSGCFINGTFIPGGTVVGCLAMAVHLDQACFGKDSDIFRPERWLNGSDTERIAMERGFLGWGAGSRVCIGRHIAELEIKKVIPTLLLKYNITLDNPNVMLPFVNGVLDYAPNPISVTFNARESDECD
ncbi:cytochrome P450 [Trichoderma barbatum]